MKISYFKIATLFFLIAASAQAKTPKKTHATASAAAQAKANSIYDCYQGFDSFPNLPQEGLKKSFFVINVTDSAAIAPDPQGKDRNKDKLLILNESGQQLMTVNPARSTPASKVANERYDVFSLKPPGESKTVETKYTTHPLPNTPDAGYFKSPRGSNALDIEVAAENPNPVTKKLSEQDAEHFLKFAAYRKLLTNQHQFSEAFNYRFALRALLIKPGVEAVKSAYNNSMEKLKSCLKYGDADLSKYANDQKNLLQDELNKVNEIIAADKPGAKIPSTDTPAFHSRTTNTGSGSATGQ